MSQPIFSGQLIVTAEPEDQCILIRAPKEIIKVYISGQFAEEVDTRREASKSVELISTDSQNDFQPPGATTVLHN